MLKRSFVLKPSRFEWIFLQILLVICLSFIVGYLENLGHFSLLLSVIVIFALVIAKIETHDLHSKIEFKDETIISTTNGIIKQAIIVESLIISPIGIAFYGIDEENKENKEKIFYKFIFRDSVDDEDWWRFCLISNYYRGISV